MAARSNLSPPSAFSTSPPEDILQSWEEPVSLLVEGGGGGAKSQEGRETKQERKCRKCNEGSFRPFTHIL